MGSIFAERFQRMSYGEILVKSAKDYLKELEIYKKKL
jgi:hypothetical protein